MNKVLETLMQIKQKASRQLSQKGSKKNIRYMVFAYGLLCFVVLCFFIYLNTIDTEAYEQQLKNYVQDKYNGTLELGSTSWSVLPVPSFDIGASSIKNHQDETLLEFDSAQFRLSIMSLFDDKIDIQTVKVSNPVLHINNEKETSNWRNLYKNPDNIKESFFLDLVDLFKDTSFNELPFHNIDIINGTVYQKNPYYTVSVKEINFKINDLAPGQTADVEATGRIKLEIHHENMPEMKASFLSRAAQVVNTLESQLDMSGKIKLQNKVFQFAQLHFKGDMTGLSKKTIPFLISSQGYYNLEIGELVIDPIEIQLSESKLLSSVKVEITDSRDTETVVTIPPQKPRLGRILRHWVTITPSTDHILDLIQSMELGGHLISTDKTIGLKLKPFNIDAHPGEFEISMNKQTGHIVSAINLSRIDARPVLDPVKNPNQVSITKETLDSIPDLENVSGLMDDLTTETQVPQLGDIYLPRKTLQTLAMDLELKIGTFIHPSYEIKGFSGYINADNGIITFKPVKFLAFNGNINVQARLDTNQSPMQFSLHQSSERVNIGDMMERTTHHRWLTGLFDNKIDVKSNGKTVNDLITNATGTLDIRMSEAIIPEANFHRIAYESIEALKGILPSSRRGSVEKDPALQSKGTLIEDFFASFVISKENIKSDRVPMLLNNQPVYTQINYSRSQGALQLIAPVKLQSMDDVLSSITWPVICRLKDWSLPRCGVDTRNTRQQAKDLLDGTIKTSDQTSFDESLQQIQNRKY